MPLAKALKVAKTRQCIKQLKKLSDKGSFFYWTNFSCRLGKMVFLKFVILTGVRHEFPSIQFLLWLIFGRQFFFKKPH